MKNLPDCAIVLVLMALPAVALAARTDTVLLVNGNTITGEIESYEFGDLEYATDSMGTVRIDWEDVVGVTSNQSLQVEVADGTRFFGSLRAAEQRFHINVVTTAGPVELATDAIVRITPIETADRLLQRLEGGISLGLNSQKGSEVTTFNAAADVRYRTLKYLAGITLNSSVTDQPSEETQSRHTARITYQRFRPNRWFTDWSLGWESNDQLGISSRTSLGVGVGRFVVQTNRNQLSLIGGAQATREEFRGQDPGATVAEGRLQLRYLHRSLKPDTNIRLTTNVYPLLEDLGTYRTESDLTFSREFISDLDFEINLFYTFQSEPPTEGSRTDRGIITSLSYSW